MAEKDIELTEVEEREDILNNEMDYLAGLLDAADNANRETKRIEIVRGGKLYFAFSVHSLSEEEIEEIRKKYTKYAKSRRNGIRVAEELDSPKFKASLIFNSTVEEDQEKLWNNETVKKTLSAKGYVIINALDVIETVLLPGEKTKIIDILDEMNGYDNEEVKIATAKN